MKFSVTYAAALAQSTTRRFARCSPWATHRLRLLRRNVDRDRQFMSPRWRGG
jgi:hypothetical protein